MLEGSLELEQIWSNSTSESLRGAEVVVNTFSFSILLQVKLFHSLDVTT